MRIIVFLLSLILFGQPALAGESCLTQKFRNLKSFRMNFVQEMKIPVAGDRVVLYRGVIYYKRPFKFRWEYTSGADVSVISDGRSLWVYSQGNCQPLDLFNENSVFPLIEVAENPESFERIFSVTTEGSAVILRPKRRDYPFSEVRFIVDGDCNIRRMITVQRDGTTATYFFENISVNEYIPDEVFHPRACR